MTTLAHVSQRRRLTDQVARSVTLVLTLIAIVPLVLIVYYLIKEGVGAWSGDFFSTDPTGRFLGDPGGIKSAIWGTLIMVALASAIAIPAARRIDPSPSRISVCGGVNRIVSRPLSMCHATSQ